MLKRFSIALYLLTLLLNYGSAHAYVPNTSIDYQIILNASSDMAQVGVNLPGNTPPQKSSNADDKATDTDTTTNPPAVGDKNTETNVADSVDAQYQRHDRRQTTRATIGSGSILVRSDSDTASNSLAGLNRDQDLAQELTKDTSHDWDVYYSDKAHDIITDPDKLLDTIDPRLLTASVAGNMVMGADFLDNLLSDAVNPATYGGAGTQGGNRGWIADQAAEHLAGQVEDQVFAAGQSLFNIDDHGHLAVFGLGENNDQALHYERLQAARADNLAVWAELTKLRANEAYGEQSTRDGVDIINNATDFDFNVTQATADTAVDFLAGRDVETLLYQIDGAGAPSTVHL